MGRFLGTLTQDVEALDELEQRLTGLLDTLASLQLKAPNKERDVMFGRGEVRRLLEWSPRLRRLRSAKAPGPRRTATWSWLWSSAVTVRPGC